MTQATHTEHAVTICGAEVTLPLPSSFDEGDRDEFVAHVEGMIEGFKGSQAKGRVGAEHYFSIVTKLDPGHTRGHALYYDQTIKRLKDVVKATAGVTESAISRHFSELREGLDPGHPWYLDPNRTENSSSGGPAKGSTKQTSKVGAVQTRIEDPDRFEVESLVTALGIRLKNLDPKELKNAVGFITELEDLKDQAIPHGLGVVHGYIRQGGGS